MTTIVQQLDAQGPAVVDRITTQVGPLACSPEDVRKIVEALHTGTPVTLTSNVSGQTQTATFTPTGSPLGYGEAYIALAIAAEQLRTAGVTGCATADQWQAVLFGGPASASTSGTSGSTSVVTSSSSTQFPGILTLRSQGQGWGQIAQTTNVRLGEIVSNVRSSLGSDALAPTGVSSSEMNKGRSESSRGWAKGHDKEDKDKIKKNKNKGSSGSHSDVQDDQSDKRESDRSTSQPDQ